MADHTISVNLVAGKVVVADEHGSAETTGHFLQTYEWCTTGAQLTVNFKNGSPFPMQSTGAIVNPVPGSLVCGNPVRVYNPLKNSYPYGGVLTVGNQAYNYDPKVIIDGSMGDKAAIKKYVAVLVAVVGAAFLIHRLFLRSST